MFLVGRVGNKIASRFFPNFNDFKLECIGEFLFERGKKKFQSALLDPPGTQETTFYLRVVLNRLVPFHIIDVRTKRSSIPLIREGKTTCSDPWCHRINGDASPVSSQLVSSKQPTAAGVTITIESRPEGYIYTWSKANITRLRHILD